jgi:hypothetical protein
MKKIIFSTFIFIPIISFAAITDLEGVFDYMLVILGVASDILTSLAMAWFFWSLIKFIWISKEGKEDIVKHKDMLIWSSVALFIMVGLWSIIGYVQTSTGVDLSQSDIDRTPVLPVQY